MRFKDTDLRLRDKLHKLTR